MNKEILKDSIINIVSNSNYALDADIIFKKSHCKDFNDFVKVVTELKNEGKLIFTKNGKIASSSSSGLYPAKIISMSQGFSFAKRLDKDIDVLIYNEHLRGAIVGDTVLLYKLKKSDKGFSASVQRITEKVNRTLTGYIRRAHKGCELIPDGAYRITIPIRKSSTLGAKNGDKVQVSLSPVTRRNKLTASVIKVYGKSDSAKVCADAIIDAYKIPSLFPKDVINEAQNISKLGISKEELSGRLDLRNELIFTIDGADAKDLDDAISVKKTNEGWDLGVHIADVSHYVKENSLLDKEAHLRGTSVYFADRVIPMLPKELSNGICSLNAGEDKLTFSCLMKLDKSGHILSYEFKKTVINSKVRGVYSEINDILENTATPAILEKYKVVLDSIKDASELADILINNAKIRGNMDLDSVESRFTLDKNGICINISKRVSGKSEKMIEQFMISANQSAAMYAKKENIPFVYRVHEGPNPERLNDLSNLISILGFKNYKIKPGMSALDFAQIIEKSKSGQFSAIISNQILRSMSKAKYSSSPLGHFGLSLDDYCHFTSPIRRYPDLSIHRILSDLICGCSNRTLIKKYSDFVIESSRDSSIYEVRAMNAERDTEKCYMAEYMTQHIGEVYDGIISGAMSKGMFVMLENSVEGFVALDLFKNSNYVFEPPISFIDKKSGNKLKMGDKIKVKVIAASVANSIIDFEPVENDSDSIS